MYTIHAQTCSCTVCVTNMRVAIDQEGTSAAILRALNRELYQKCCVLHAMVVGFEIAS